ncbi:MAG: hypothetical protein NZ108_04475, partial [Bacteroidia bacterium]|nr:hypothetical protein [Bacteroidia bacterium]
GFYNVVALVNGCTSIVSTVNVTINPVPQTPSVSSNAPVCEGSTIQLAASSNLGVSYSWTGPNGFISNQQNPTIPNSTPANGGVYSVLAIQGNCSSAVSSINVVVTNGISDPVVHDTTICQNSSATLIVLNAVQGATYTWTNTPNGNVLGLGATFVTPILVTSTTFFVQASIPGCNSSVVPVTVSVNNQSSPLVSVVTNDSILCIGESALLTASGADTYTWNPIAGLSSGTGAVVTAAPTSTTTYTVTGFMNGCSATDTIVIFVSTVSVNVSADDSSLCDTQSATLTATGADSYLWSPSTGLSSTTGSVVIANPSSTTTYTVIGTSNLGCSDSDTIVISTLTTTPILITTQDDSLCIGDVTQLIASNAVSYNWNPSAGLSSSTQNIVLASPTVTTTYTVTGFDANGCAVSGNFVLTVSNYPLISVSATDSTLCPGQSTILSASGAVAYDWFPTVGLNSSTGATVNASPVQSTTYSVSGTTDGCTSTATIMIQVQTPPTISIFANDSSICVGESATLFATGALNYVWSPATGLSSTIGSSVSASPTQTTTYTVTGTDVFGCSSSKTFILQVNQPAVLSVIASDDTLCPGQSATLTAFGGTNYTWSPANGLSSTAGSPVISTPSQSLTYTISGIDANGCQATGSIALTVLNSAAINISLSGSDTLCPMGSVTMTANGASSYTWLPASGLNTIVGTTVTANPSVTTTYTVTGSVSGCTVSATQIIVVLPAPIISVSANDSSICLGDSVTLFAQGADSYTWSPAVSLSSTTGSTVIATPTQTTTYTVSGVDAFGCTSLNQATLTIQVGTSGTIVANAMPSQICVGDTTRLSAIGSHSYTWSGTGLLATSGSIVQANPTQTTTYTVTGMDLAGCQTSATVVVTVNSVSPVSLIASDSVICLGDTVQFTAITASGGFFYFFNQGILVQSGPNPVYLTSQLAPGNSISVMYQHGSCSVYSNAISVVVNPVPSATVV